MPPSLNTETAYRLLQARHCHLVGLPRDSEENPETTSCSSLIFWLRPKKIDALLKFTPLSRKKPNQNPRLLLSQNELPSTSANGHYTERGDHTCFPDTDGFSTLWCQPRHMLPVMGTAETLWQWTPPSQTTSLLPPRASSSGETWLLQSFLEQNLRFLSEICQSFHNIRGFQT